MEASVFLGGGWLDGSNEAVQLGPADGAHLSSSHEAGFSPAHAAAHSTMHPGMRWLACHCTAFPTWCHAGCRNSERDCKAVLLSAVKCSSACATRARAALPHCLR